MNFNTRFFNYFITFTSIVILLGELAYRLSKFIADLI
ncbi:hypothetical protein DI53_0113 [Sphingobacterium deserti]|uniref:Uncharacterized protein n=1 Tax=Sphingobacterium deserti TaxID=1229276 RepID=A0A0B8T5P3_9SPHI|nr:hypothetical protein DI53_0113 [Sphingobacterium deserti]